MPEIAPSPDFAANIDQPFTERSSAQAWGTYGVLWPVVHYELGVAPDLGRRARRRPAGTGGPAGSPVGHPGRHRLPGRRREPPRPTG